jgi:hypothetical protein
VTLDADLPVLLLPTNDLVFKALLERNRAFLDTMLSAVLGRDVEVEEILNPGLPGDDVKDKMMHLDVRARFSDGRRAFIEMQATSPRFVNERFVAYLGREYSSQLRLGAPYADITATIGVVWQVGAPHLEYGFHECFRLRGDRSGEIYTDALALEVGFGFAGRLSPRSQAQL